MRQCSYCGQEYPDSAMASAIDRQPLSSGASSGAPGAEVELDATLPPPDLVLDPFVPPHRSWLGRLLGNRLTWFSILGLAWALHSLGDLGGLPDIYRPELDGLGREERESRLL